MRILLALVTKVKGFLSYSKGKRAKKKLLQATCLRPFITNFIFCEQLLLICYYDEIRITNNCICQLKSNIINFIIQCIRKNGVV